MMNTKIFTGLLCTTISAGVVINHPCSLMPSIAATTMSKGFIDDRFLVPDNATRPMLLSDSDYNRRLYNEEMYRNEDNRILYNREIYRNEDNHKLYNREDERINYNRGLFNEEDRQRKLEEARLDAERREAQKLEKKRRTESLQRMIQILNKRY